MMRRLGTRAFRDQSVGGLAIQQGVDRILGRPAEVVKGEVQGVSVPDHASIDPFAFSRKRVTEIMEAAEREEQRPMRTAWDAAQGITATARSIQHSDERITLEREAQKILDRAAA